MIVQIDDYFIGMIFKGNQLVKNTIPLRGEEIFNFINGEVISNPKEEYLKIAEIILKLYFAEIDDKEARELINYKLEVPTFTRKVLDIVKDIEFGETLTYGDIAKKLNTSPRAVGMALKRNPLPLIIPCHRVVAKNSLGGYSYGLDKKKFILERERIKNKKYKKAEDETA
ncbi:methylated-DNA/protein-cysteine methyltransferase [Methanocaldococcus sp. FS406-22]|uniref:methylated-DNA--[protein]-cysteine S-methyltransferase n=1 Tax=Methanocaldococcus sp. (strain FS406-22) TaxID=644281 RepID=UPI0001BF53F5|nr:methylated-DNA--[protein]-cysteine S-methyltransferase [Methanocaldococcus sp. FS406-22]ADC69441.1 methylated-DNA/protein-cysteine methyltransferase [Methanocaldococcus sp. FS406-22]